MRTYQEVNLTDDPFKDITPSISKIGQTSLLWAGMPEIKKKISKVYERTLTGSARQVVLNWGPYGGGKTFSACYFLGRHSVSRKNEIGLSQAYIFCPKEGARAPTEFFQNVLDFISYSKIRKQVGIMIERMGENRLFEFINSTIRSEEFTKAILMLGSSNPEIADTMNRYIYTGLTKTELKQVGLPRNISSNTDYVRFLSGIISCFIGDQDKHKGRFVLWIDEMEDLIYFTQRYYLAFSQVLRSLIDILNEYFTVFMNFTLAEPKERAIETVLGGAIWSRINTKIRFQELSPQDALIYCKELIAAHKVDKSKEFVPFNEQALRALFSLIPGPEMTPREINRNGGKVLEYFRESDERYINKKLIVEWSSRTTEEE